jgi:hypothetical protein
MLALGLETTLARGSSTIATAGQNELNWWSGSVVVIIPIGRLI